MDRLLWAASEIGSLIWFAPAFLLLAYAAWRGGYMTAALALACLLVGSMAVMMPLTAFDDWPVQIGLAVASSAVLRLLLPKLLSSES